MALHSFLLGIYMKISFKGGPLERKHQPKLRPLSLKDTSDLPSLVYIFSSALTAFPHTLISLVLCIVFLPHHKSKFLSEGTSVCLVYCLSHSI